MEVQKAKSLRKTFHEKTERVFRSRKRSCGESDVATDSEVNVKESEYINAYKANDPEIGYNQ